MLEELGTGVPGGAPEPAAGSAVVGGREAAPARRRAQQWRRTYLGAVLLGDAVAALGSGLLAQVIRFGSRQPTPLSTTVHVPYLLLSLGLVPLWLLVLALTGTFDERRLGIGAEEYRAVAQATLPFIAVVCAGAFLFHLDYFSRGWVLLLLPFIPGLTLLDHWSVRRWLHRRRGQGRYQRPTVVVGSPAHVADLVDHVRQAPFAGLDIVGTCVPAGAVAPPVTGEPVTVVAPPRGLLDWLRRGGAEQVLVADMTVFGTAALRRLAWDLETLGVDLIVAPAITQFAGPRIAVRQAAGLPLLHVEAPRLAGFDRLVKGVIERIFALVMLVALLPLLAAAAVAIKLTSRGPALYRQQRVGRGGKFFTMWKLRTMVDGADTKVGDLRLLNEADGCLFKIKRDPRVTRVGRLLRRFSIDELPQLVHVLTGRMAVVGPRPLPASDLTTCDDETRRRLLVLPGLTGLWQVSGRWELSWLESVRLDLYYVENWSLAFDAVILAKTLGAVLRRHGAS